MASARYASSTKPEPARASRPDSVRRSESSTSRRPPARSMRWNLWNELFDVNVSLVLLGRRSGHGAEPGGGAGAAWLRFPEDSRSSVRHQWQHGEERYAGERPRSDDQAAPWGRETG